MRDIFLGGSLMLGGIDKERLPIHIAIIMDGNGRWAQQKNLPRVMGHKAGMEALMHFQRKIGNAPRMK